MKKALIAALALAAAPALAAEFTVDPQHSSVGFQVRHLFSKVSGNFKDFEGTFSFDEKSIDKSQVKFSIKTASVDTRNEKRDNDLRSANFFDAQNLPAMEFASKKVTSLGKKKFRIEGDLTLHGVTKPIRFDAEYLGTDKDPWGNVRAGFTATSKLNRKDYGMNFHKVLESGGLLVGDEISIGLEIEAIEKKEAQK